MILIKPIYIRRVPPCTLRFAILVRDLITWRSALFCFDCDVIELSTTNNSVGRATSMVSWSYGLDRRWLHIHHELIRARSRSNKMKCISQLLNNELIKPIEFTECQGFTITIRSSWSSMYLRSISRRCRVWSCTNHPRLNLISKCQIWVHMLDCDWLSCVRILIVQVDPSQEWLPIVGHPRRRNHGFSHQVEWDGACRPLRGLFLCIVRYHV